MKTKLISLFLCLVMLMTLVLSSCSEKTDEEVEGAIKEEASESAITLTMWVVSEDKVPDEATQNRIETAINDITNSKFKTQIVLQYYTEAEYRTELEKSITAYEENRKNNPVQTPTESETGETEAVTDEYVTDKDGMSFIKYPEVLENQVDIIYVAGEDMYVDFINKGWLAELDTELSSSSKKIKEYVSATLLSAAKYNGTTYAIPNNRPIGEYTYMLLNKDLMKACSWDANVKTNMIDGLYSENLYPFLTLIDLMNTDLRDADNQIIPIDATYEECLELLAYYWNINSSDYSISELQKFSLFGYHYTNIEELSRGSVVLGYNSLFEDEDFVEAYLKLNEFRFKNYLRGENDTRTEAAVKFIKGDSTILETKDDEGVSCYTDENGNAYYPIVVAYPSASSEDIYGNMFGVSAYTRSVPRSMEIITYLNTNPDFRNLLQYGVEKEDYNIVKNHNGDFVEIEILNKEYKMDIYATGNTFIAYPNEGMSADIWESGKVQNRSSLVNPLLGFNFGEFSATTGPEAEAVAIDKTKGYTVSYSTGYSKEILSQNAVIAKWLSDCDAKAEKGVFLLRTSSTSGQNIDSAIYVYNNKGDADFTLVESPITETNEEGETVTTGYDLLLTYANQKASGYELSVINFDRRKTVNPSWKVSEGEVISEPTEIVEHGAVVDFDFLNTTNYTIEVYNNLSATAVIKNVALFEWITKADASDKASTHMICYQNGNEYTYVIYRTKLSNENEIIVQPVGDAKNLKLNIAVQQYSDIKIDTKVDPVYELCYIRVKALADDVTVGYEYTLNGKKETIPEANMSVNVFDPNFEMVGNLDTELVKFIERLNSALIGKLDECYAECAAKIAAGTMTADQAVEAYTALVNDICKLMDTSVEDPYTYDITNYPVLAADPTPDDEIEKLYFDLKAEVGVNASTLLSYIQSATSHEIIELKDEEGNPITYGVEEYVYFDSAYGIYYAWLEKFGFVPGEKK